MVGIFADFSASFVLGLLTPLTAVCVLPLYPGFLAYLANKLEGRADDKKLLAMFGLIVTAGVITFMFLLGLIFTTFLQASLTNVIGIVSPIAFGILAFISIFLIFNINIGKFIPKVNAPVLENPLTSAYVFGFFFGAIVVPCNPLFIAALFTKILSSGMNFVVNILNFVLFGIGMGFPLIIFSLLSAKVSSSVIGAITQKSRQINLFAGIILLVISLYYLIYIFKVLG